jgi:hypothetical protein
VYGTSENLYGEWDYESFRAAHLEVCVCMLGTIGITIAGLGCSKSISNEVNPHPYQVIHIQ